jgi:hypothetical protein
MGYTLAEILFDNPGTQTSDWVQHANGGGWKMTNCTVDATASLDADSVVGYHSIVGAHSVLRSTYIEESQVDTYVTLTNCYLTQAWCWYKAVANNIVISGSYSFQTAQNATDTVTFALGSPGLMTATRTGWKHPLAIAVPVRFTTTDTLPTGIVAGTTYYLAPSVVRSDVYFLYDTSQNATLGTATGQIALSSTQAGVHTMTVQGYALVYTPQVGTVTVDGSTKIGAYNAITAD